MKCLFLDDFREPEDVLAYTSLQEGRKYIVDDWIVVKSYQEFVGYIKKHGLPDVISFDHDLSEEHYSPLMYSTPKEYNALYKTFKEKTGFDAAKWLKRYAKRNNLSVPMIYCHSRNPIGKNNILNTFK